MADYISREAAVKLLTSIALEVPDSKRRAVAKCINQVELMPAADVEPVRYGRWIDPPWVYYGARQYICDQCKDDEYWRKRCLNFEEKYCPNCGAIMSGGEIENGV